MKHSILAALSAVLTKYAILHAAGAEQWRNALTRVSKSAWLASHPLTFFALACVFGSVKLRPILRVEPRLMFKFLHDYLTTDLSPKERAAMLIHHYAFLEERAEAGFFRHIVDQRIELWQLTVDEHAYRIWLLFPRTPHSEGDLTLMFEADGVDIYNLSFTIGPGAIAGVDARDAMYIARVQGKGRGVDRIREATRNCLDVSPATLLLTAAEGIATALGLKCMIGIGADTHVISRENEKLDNLVKAYDEFWTAAGGSRLSRNMYELAVPSPGKPILAVKRDHRSRTHRKRRFKKTVKEQVHQAFRGVAGQQSAIRGSAAT